MAASAQEKAYNLKDSYVAGLIEGGATAPAPAMPTQDMGEQASILVDLDSGQFTARNDGDPHSYIARKGTTLRMGNPDARYPLGDEPVGASRSLQMNRAQHEGQSRSFENMVQLDRRRQQMGMPETNGIKVFQNRSGY